MVALSKRIENLSESETIAMSQRSHKLKCEGYDVINLSIGEPDFFTPNNIKDAAKTAIDNNFTFYTPVNGYQELREEICNKFKRDNNLDFSPEQIVVTTGAKQAIANAILCLADADEEIIIPAPYWVSYSGISEIAGTKSIIIKTSIDNDFKITPEQLEKAITPQTKLFVFSSPSNPTGTVYSKQELKSLAAVFERYPHVYIISDEIYEYINYSNNHESIAQFSNIKPRVILVNGVSKAFSMTGWRLGYLAADKEISKACTKLQGQFTSGTSSISQRAAIEAMKTSREKTKYIIDEFNKRRDMVLRMLDDIPDIKTYTPDGSFYIFPDVSPYFGKSAGKNVINNSNDLCMYILNTAHVALVPGSAFGDPNCIRISYATSIEILTEAVNRLKKALKDLK